MPLRTLQGTKPPERSKVTEVVFGKLQVPLIKINDVGNSYIVICRKETDNTGAEKELGKIGLQAKKPQSFLARRSIVHRGQNPWLAIIVKKTPKEKLKG